MRLVRLRPVGMTKYITGLTGAIVDITGHYLYNNGTSPL